MSTGPSPAVAVPVPGARRVAGRDPRSASEGDRSGAAPRGRGLGHEQQEVVVITGYDGLIWAINYGKLGFFPGFE